MSLLRDYKEHHLNVKKRFWLKEVINPSNLRYTLKWRRQRLDRGWNDRDTWDGGRHIAQVCAGILYCLESEQNPIDWEHYFKHNYNDNYGYKSLTEVADDLQLYVEWDDIAFSEHMYKNLTFEERNGIEHQVYAQAQNAMHFVAANVGGLWW